MSKAPVTFTLNEEEFEILMRQDPATKKDGGFQSLLVNLQECTNESTLVITIPPELLARIPKYAFDFKNGGWEDRLKAIFARHLGDDLRGK